LPVTGVLTINDICELGEVVFSTITAPPLEIVEPNVAIDSREITEGGIFIALKGERTDGHRYIDAVFQQGACWAMVNRAWYEAAGSPEPPAGKGFIITTDTVLGLQRLASMYRNTFSIPVIAIGGSNGKTTTKEMVAAVFGTAFTVTMSQGNRNNHIGVPLTLLQLRRESSIAVVEVGINHPDEMAELAALVHPTHALLTNIGHEHLEFLIDLDGVAAAELQLFDYLQANGGTAFINLDDERITAAATKLSVQEGYASSQQRGALCWADSVSVERDGRLTFLLVSEQATEKVTLNFTGKHNGINAVAAATVGLHFGLPLSLIRKGLEALLPVAGWKRLEVMDAAGLRILNDTYNANSDSMRLAIDALCDMPCDGRRVAVLADMLELGVAGDVEHKRIGEYLRQQPVDRLFTFGEKAELICRQCPDICRCHVDSHEALLHALLGELCDGDAVLFKGSRGMKLEQVVEALVNAKTITQEG